MSYRIDIPGTRRCTPIFIQIQLVKQVFGRQFIFISVSIIYVKRNRFGWQGVDLIPILDTEIYEQIKQ